MTTLFNALVLADGQQVFRVPGGPQASQQLVFACSNGYPAAGTLSLEYQLVGSTAWLPAYKGANLPITAPVVLATQGMVSGYRVTIAGLGAGGGGFGVWVGEGSGFGFPDGAFVGLRALTVQPYTEANVKNGVQFYARAVWPLADPIVTGEPGSRRIWVKTGAKGVLVKLRDFQYVAEEMRIQLFHTPTGVAGGTPLTIHNYNAVNPVATTVQALKNVTVATDGVEIDGGDPEYFFGAATSGNRTQASIPQGRERVLPPNTEFIVKLTNLSTGGGSAARAQYYLDWYEGGTDLPA